MAETLREPIPRRNFLKIAAGAVAILGVPTTLAVCARLIDPGIGDGNPPPIESGPTGPTVSESPSPTISPEPENPYTDLKPTGEILVDNKPFLGVLTEPAFDPSDGFTYTWITGVLVDKNIDDETFQLYFGEYRDGSPRLVTFTLGRIDRDTNIARGRTSDWGGVGSGSYPDSKPKKATIRELQIGHQYGIDLIIQSDGRSFENCDEVCKQVLNHVDRYAEKNSLAYRSVSNSVSPEGLNVAWTQRIYIPPLLPLDKS